MSKFVPANGIRIHLIDHPGGDPPLVLLHGLSANAHAFDGYIAAGLSPRFRVLCPDLRGRGLSDHPGSGYSIHDHALDLLAMLDELKLEKVVLGGHSFGALVSIYMANHFPERIEKILMIDAAARLHPKVREMVAPSMSRLTKTFPSFENYLEQIRSAPYMEGRWLPEMESYYRADVEIMDDGTAKPRSELQHIALAIQGALDEGVDWLHLIQHIPHPTLLVRAEEPYSLGAPILPKENALETVAMIPDCIYAEVPGNHLTMLFGKGAEATAKLVKNFVEI